VPTLHLLRHAKSSWDDPSLADHDRPLAGRGRRDGKRIAEHMRRSGIEPELVLCSTAARTRETLALVEPALGSPTVELEDDLYGASSDELLARVRRLPAGVESALVIGHNPGLHELALALAPGAPFGKFPTGALASFAFAEGWDGPATLAAYVVPKELP
jgi:phosphohistidine phosphatase